MAAAPKKQADLSTYAGRFAARLRMLREKAGLSVEEVVIAANAPGWPLKPLKPTTYYNWETAKSEPPLNALPRLAHVLGQKSPRSLMPLD